MRHAKVASKQWFLKRRLDNSHCAYDSHHQTGECCSPWPHSRWSLVWGGTPHDPHWVGLDCPYSQTPPMTMQGEGGIKME